MKLTYCKSLVLLMILSIAFNNAKAQSPWARLAKRPSTLGLEQGSASFDTKEFYLQLVNASQTVASLRPKADSAFDFVPADSLKIRSSDGFYHLGDINLRLKQATDTGWKDYSTARLRKPVEALKVSGNTIAAANLAASLPAEIPLQVKRFWETDQGQLVLRFELTNITQGDVEIGSLGMPLVFDNFLGRRSLEEAHAKNVLYDPYTGMDAGYLQVTRLNGHAPSLLVVPEGNTPFEAYNPLLDDPTPRGIGFEGFYEWMACSKAYAEKEWKAADPWNAPHSIVLKPGEVRSFGLRFVVSGTPKELEADLVANQRPVAVGLPGYVLPQDVQGKLFLKYSNPVKSITVEPAGAIAVSAPAPAKNGWQAIAVQGKTFGRARLTITYENGLVQTVFYKVIKPENVAIADYGRFLTTKQWYDDPNDPFHRSPGVISYDNIEHKQVTQDERAWIAGLGDEAGSGSWLGAVMKQLVLPNKAEINKLESFINKTLWGGIQYNEGPNKFGVRKSLFFYAPDSMPAGTYRADINYKTWAAWPIKEARSVGRSYNYPHVAAAYWVMYRLARNHAGLVTSHDWNWYLQHAYETAIAMVEQSPQYAEFGQMEGSVFYFILKDLKAEGKTELVTKLEALMKKRAIHWHSLTYPFGSEMPWDSTGQEEVYIWSLFFGYEEKAQVTLDAILAYMPTIPSWAYNGNARRYWDFLYAGKLTRIERMIHHYGSELNAIPVLTAYRKDPSDFYLLRVGYGGVLGGISNITEDGFAPCAFHSYPATLANDGYSGDYGSGFYGYAVNSATYLVDHPDFGWVAFGGNVSSKGNWITVEPTTAAKDKLFFSPAGLWLTLDAGRFKSASYNKSTGEIKIELEPKDAYTPAALLKIESPAQKDGKTSYTLESNSALKRGLYTIPLSTAATEIMLSK